MIDHKYPLKPKIDYCSDCCLLHNGVLEGLSHALSHVLMYRDNKSMLEHHYGDAGLNDWLAPIFQAVDDQRKKVLLRMFFNDAPELEDIILQI